MSEPFIGQMMIVGFNFPPRGWAFCDGQLLPIAQNTALFSLLGTTYGGDGRTTFALPDMRGRSPIEPGRGPGLSIYTWGEKGGTEDVTLTLSQLPNHGHQMYSYNQVGNALSPKDATWAEDAAATAITYSDEDPDVQMSAAALGTAGGSQPHTNLQPYLAMYFCIALVGLYPSRS